MTDSSIPDVPVFTDVLSPLERAALGLQDELSVFEIGLLTYPEKSTSQERKRLTDFLLKTIKAGRLAAYGDPDGWTVIKTDSPNLHREDPYPRCDGHEGSTVPDYSQFAAQFGLRGVRDPNYDRQTPQRTQYEGDWCLVTRVDYLAFLASHEACGIPQPDQWKDSQDAQAAQPETSAEKPEWLPLDERRLVPFEKAFARLRERFPDTTVGEVVMWISHSYPFANDEDREDVLPAYRCSLLPDDPEERDWAAVHGSAFLTGDTISSIHKIHDLFFPPKALEIFKPKVRWLSYGQLTTRWDCDESLIAKRIRQTGNSPFAFWPHPLYQDAPLSESMFSIDQVEEIGMRFELADRALLSATALKTFTSETGEVLLRTRNTYPVGLFDNYQRYRRLDDYPKPDRLAMQVHDGSLRIAVKAHRWRAYLVLGNPDSSQSTIDEYGWSRDGGPPKGSAPLLIEGFWYLEGQEASRVLSGYECRVNWLLPTDPTELHRRWPDLFPEGEFHLDLEKWMKFEREDLLWLDASSELEAKPIKPTSVSQGESDKSEQGAVATRQIALVEAENAALAALRKELNRKPSFEEFWDYIIERDDTGTIADHTDDRLMWTGKDGRDCETAKSTMRNRFAEAKKRNPFNPSS